MWLTGTSLERIDSALGRGPTAEVDRLLTEILAGAAATDPTPTTCAVCRRDLTRSHLHHSSILIYSCPDGHGSWLDGAGVAALQRLLQERVAPGSGAPVPPPAPSPGVQVRGRLRVLIALLVAAMAMLVGTIVMTSGPAPTPPPTPPGPPPAPMTSAERRYFEELVVVLDEGIATRFGIDGVLKGQSSPDTYVSAFEIYLERQDRFRRRLDDMVVPARLQPIHEAIRRAAARQVGFYRDFKEARVKSPTDLPNLIGHPDLRESDYELHRAWDLIRQTYPVLDPRLAEAIEGHLCRLDIV